MFKRSVVGFDKVLKLESPKPDPKFPKISLKVKFEAEAVLTLYIPSNKKDQAPQNFVGRMK